MDGSLTPLILTIVKPVFYAAPYNSSYPWLQDKAPRLSDKAVKR